MAPSDLKLREYASRRGAAPSGGSHRAAAVRAHRGACSQGPAVLPRVIAPAGKRQPARAAMKFRHHGDRHRVGVVRIEAHAAPILRRTPAARDLQRLSGYALLHRARR